MKTQEKIKKNLYQKVTMKEPELTPHQSRQVNSQFKGIIAMTYEWQQSVRKLARLATAATKLHRAKMPAAGTARHATRLRKIEEAMKNYREHLDSHRMKEALHNDLIKGIRAYHLGIRRPMGGAISDAVHKLENLQTQLKKQLDPETAAAKKKARQESTNRYNEERAAMREGVIERAGR